MTVQLRYFREGAGAVKPSLARAFAAVHEAVVGAATEASQRLGALGIRHALVGGLAVGAHGAPRNTTDVDFLVGMETFDESGHTLVHRSGVPVRVGDVAIDLIPAEDPVLERALAAAVAEPPDGDSAVPLVALPVLIHLKLRALGAQDQEDVRGLIRAGANLGAIRNHLAAVAPALLSRLDYVLSHA